MSTVHPARSIPEGCICNISRIFGIYLDTKVYFIQTHFFLIMKKAFPRFYKDFYKYLHKKNVYIEGLIHPRIGN
jgi:hypothetical protein